MRLLQQVMVSESVNIWQTDSLVYQSPLGCSLPTVECQDANASGQKSKTDCKAIGSYGVYEVCSVRPRLFGGIFLCANYRVYCTLCQIPKRSLTLKNRVLQQIVGIIHQAQSQPKHQYADAKVQDLPCFGFGKPRQQQSGTKADTKKPNQ